MTDLAKSPFPETADIETSSDEYAGRFAGPAGEWMLKVQEDITLDLLKPTGAKSILDVGGGHGQLAHPLCREGYNVTVLGSALSCEKRIRDLVLAKRCEFVVGNVIALPFPDRSFDVVISFRMVTHCAQWPVLIKELCRVAKDAVIIDYPTSQSVNAIAPFFFEAKKKVEVDTRTWALFRHAQIRDELARNGYRIDTRRGQFFFPMVVHRMLKSRGLSAAMESVTRAIGLNNLCGSPVIVKMTRDV
ncbi:MAG: class I SAM-dependent methyltransferase [bacterium]